MQKAYISFTSTLLIGFFFVIAYSRAFNESMMFKDGPCENLFMGNEMFFECDETVHFRGKWGTNTCNKNEYMSFGVSVLVYAPINAHTRGW